MKILELKSINDSLPPFNTVVHVYGFYQIGITKGFQEYGYGFSGVWSIGERLNYQDKLDVAGIICKAYDQERIGKRITDDIFLKHITLWGWYNEVD